MCIGTAHPQAEIAAMQDAHDFAEAGIDQFEEEDVLVNFTTVREGERCNKHCVWVIFLLSLAYLHVGPMGRTQRRANEIELTATHWLLTGSRQVHHGKGEDNPVDRVWFYNKHALREREKGPQPAKHLESETHLRGQIPSDFIVRQIYLYSKCARTEQGKVAGIAKVRWWCCCCWWWWRCCCCW